MTDAVIEEDKPTAEEIASQCADDTELAHEVHSLLRVNNGGGLQVPDTWFTEDESFFKNIYEKLTGRRT